MRPQTIVFVEPPSVCWDRRMGRVREGEEEIPRIGTLTLAAVARAAGHRVHLVDGTVSIGNAGCIAALVKQRRPQAVVTVGARVAGRSPTASNRGPSACSTW